MTNRELQRELKEYPEDAEILLTVFNKDSASYSWKAADKVRLDKALISPPILWIDSER